MICSIFILMHGNKAKLKRSSLALLRCKFFSEFLSLAIHANENLNDANETLKISGLALLRCKLTFQIFEFGHIAAQIGLALLVFTSVVLSEYFIFIEYTVLLK